MSILQFHITCFCHKIYLTSPTFVKIFPQRSKRKNICLTIKGWGQVEILKSKFWRSSAYTSERQHGIQIHEGLEDDVPLQMGDFQVLAVNFPGV